MTVERPEIGLSEEKIEELKLRFGLFKLDELRMITLDLEPRTKEGIFFRVVRRIVFVKFFDGRYDLYVAEPSSRDFEYDQQRKPTVEEITTFVLIVVLQAPGSPLTRKLIEKAEEIVTAERDQTVSKVNSLNQALDFLDNATQRLPSKV